MTARTPPSSLDSEQGLIGCAFESAESVITDAIAFGIQSESFHDLRCRTVWQAMVSMQDKKEPVDLLTVRTRLADLGLLDGVGGAAFLLECQGACPSAANAPYFCGIIRDKHMLRRAIERGGDLIMAAYSPTAAPEEILDKAEAELMAIRGGPEKGQSRLTSAIVPAVIDVMERRMEGHTGIPTGFIDIDNVLAGGLQPSNMFVVAGRPSAGKTSWAMNVAQHVAGQWKTEGKDWSVAIFSLEMTAEDLTERMIAVESQVNTRRLQWLSPDEQRRLSLAAGTVASLPITIDDSPSLSVEAIRARARRLYRKSNARLFVVDYLQLVSTPGKAKDRRVEVDAISVGLKSLAKELKCPVIVLAQLNRDFERDRNRKPRLADLRESGQIEQDADVVTFLYLRDPDKAEEEGPDSPRDILFRVGKQRNGRRDVDVPLVFRPDITRFFSAAKVDPADMP